MDVLIART